MDAVVMLLPLLPLIAAAAIGIGHISGALSGEAGENATADMASGAIIMSCLLALILLVADLMGKNTGSFTIGQWLSSDTLDIRVNFITTGFSVALSALFALLLFFVIHFSIRYMHKEAGFHRFFFVLSLFAAAMQLLVLSGNAVGTFIGWELAGLCSYLLIAYTYQRPLAVVNATRVFVTNRIGDAAFILGLGLSYVWLGSVDWAVIKATAAQLTQGQAVVIALCFAVAAFVKSAQWPFTPWLARTMEGPTPSSAVFYGAVMVHAGVYLVILLQPLFEQAPLIMALLAITGLLTTIYSFIIGLSQTDVKSSLIFATSAQLGLMFLACGLGFWQLASWHLCAHAVVRGYQFLSAPSLLHQVHDNPIKPVAPAIANWRIGYVASIQRFWLDQLADWALVKPVRGLAHDLSYFDDHIVDGLMGGSAPALSAISSLAQLEEQLIGAHLDNDSDDFAQGSGLAGKLTEWMAAILHWFEHYFVLQGVGKNALDYGRWLGHIANTVEKSVLRPRYLVLFVLITLLVAF